MRRSDLIGFGLFFVLAASFLTYSVGENKFGFYAFALAAFSTVAAIVGIRFERGANGLLLSAIGYVLVVAAAVAFNLDRHQSVPVQLFAYPVVFFLVSGSLWKVFLLQRRAALMTLALFVANGLLALAGSLGVESIPFLGELNRGRSIFMTSIPSSSGLIWNVNYFAATQAVGFWLLYSMLVRGSLPAKSKYLVYFVGASIILGSSRSCTVAMLISIATYYFFRSGLSGKLALLVGGALLAASAGSIYLYALTDQELNAGLRLYKGFNNRDDLWAIGLDLAARSPFFGYGSVDSVQEAMMLAGASNSTAQNTALTMLLVFGLGGALIFLYLVLASAYRFLRLRSRSPEQVAVAVLLLFALIDSLVRSYIVGGVGVVPFLMCASMAYLIRLRSNQLARYGS